MAQEAKTAIIVGASSGVGDATAQALSELGFSLLLVARRRERIEALAARLEERGASVFTIAADIGEASDVRRVVAETVDRLGRIDVLVNCAGINVPRRSLAELSIADWDAIIRTNLSGAFYCVRAVLPVMRQQRSGLIVSISSVAGLRPSVLSGAAYGASKTGLNALSACINLEEAKHGIRACVICPGDIDTELMDQRPEPPGAEARRAMLRPDEVAEIVATIVRQPERVLVDEVVVRPAPAPTSPR